MENKERNEQEQLVEKAKAYFDANGLTTIMEEFFQREDIKTTIHSKYASFEESVSEIVADAEKTDLPEVIIERAQAVAEAVKGEEARYADDVKLSVMCSMYGLFVGMEKFITVDEQVLTPFKAAFTSDDNAKFMEAFNEICDGVIGKMTEKTVKMICLPHGIMGEIADILMMIGGGMPMMNMEELEKMFGGQDEDSEEE